MVQVEMSHLARALDFYGLFASAWYKFSSPVEQCCFSVLVCLTAECRIKIISFSMRLF